MHPDASRPAWHVSAERQLVLRPLAPRLASFLSERRPRCDVSVRYVEGTVTDAALARETLRLLPDDGPAPVGGVGGVTDDGRLVALLELPSLAPADAFDEHPSWQELTAACAGDPSVEVATEVSTFVSAPAAQSGFAQVIRARVTDRPTFEHVLAADAEWLARERPEVLGGMLAWHGADRFTLVVCFTDEASARAGEARNSESPGADIDQLMEDVSFDELRDPWVLHL